MEIKNEHGHEHHHTNEALMHMRVAIDNLQAIEAMLRKQKPCAEIVRQLSGVLVTLIECRGIVAQDHISSCIQAALKPGQEDVLKDVTLLFQQLLKGPLQGSHH